MSITLNQTILAGKPIIKGTRISVEFILQLLSSGITPEEICSEYHHLKKKDVLEALYYATSSFNHEEFIF